MIKNEYTLVVDVKKKHTAIVPTFVQHDSATLIFKVYDGGKPFDLTDVTEVQVSHKRKDGRVIVGLASFQSLNSESIIKYEYLGNEMSVEGFVETSVTIFAEKQQVTIQPFKVSIVGDFRNVLGAVEERGLLQDLIVKAREITIEAIKATQNANTAADRANASARNADEKAALVIANEEERKSSETLRKSSESEREISEATRKSNESTRVLEEGVRKTSEGVRINAETTRTIAESGRTAAENKRVLDETERISAESERKTKETARISAESARKTAEDDRLLSETDRKTSETDRKSSETARKSNESTRVTQEDGRKTAEGLRVSAEASRKTAETDRVAAESKRQTDTSAAINATNTAKNNAQAIADNTKYSDDYSHTKAYKKNNIVNYNGSSYMAKQDTTGNYPPDLPTTNNLHWGLMSVKGVDGVGTVGTFTEVFTATEGQRIFNLKNAYNMNQNRVQVFIGGSLQVKGENYTETSSKSITTVDALPLGIDVIINYFGQALPLASDIQTQVDNLQAVVNDSIVSAPFNQQFTATANQTAFTLTNTYPPNKGRVKVIIGGVEQFSGIHFTETNNKTITMVAGVPLGEKVIISYS